MPSPQNFEDVSGLEAPLDDATVVKLVADLLTDEDAVERIRVAARRSARYLDTQVLWPRCARRRCGRRKTETPAEGVPARRRRPRLCDAWGNHCLRSLLAIGLTEIAEYRRYRACGFVGPWSNTIGWLRTDNMHYVASVSEQEPRPDPSV